VEVNLFEGAQTETLAQFCILFKGHFGKKIHATILKKIFAMYMYKIYILSIVQLYLKNEFHIC
jgi:hypothetical protein